MDFQKKIVKKANNQTNEKVNGVIYLRVEVVENINGSISIGILI
jgi:hypothetical protein